MSGADRGRPRRGFALVMVVALLALMVLCVFSLSVLVRVGGELSTAGTHQTRARQNALLALGVGLSELQRHAGDDERITGMAGVTGIGAGANQRTRHWCGVWSGGGDFVAWLVSGAQPGSAAALPGGVELVTLVGPGSVGASSGESEQVVAGRVPIPLPDDSGLAAVAAGGGGYAYLVSDEGAKISAYSPADRLADPAAVPRIAASTTGSAQGRLRSALSSYGTRLGEVISYEQLSLLPAPAKALTPSTLKDNFHHVTLTALSVIDGQLRSGTVNLNTTSRHVWNSVLETYNAVPGVKPIPSGVLDDYGTAIAAEFADESSGKSLHGPFASVATFGGSALLSRHLPDSVKPAEFMAAIGAILRVRSDTFRIRAYGDAGNAGVSARALAVAYCEAVVQRVPDPAVKGAGRRFEIVYFRWLGPDDI